MSARAIFGDGYCTSWRWRNVSVLGKGRLAAAGVACVISAAVGVATGAPVAALASTPAYSIADVGAYGGEPSIVSDRLGQLYDTTPSGGTITGSDSGRLGFDARR